MRCKITSKVRRLRLEGAKRAHPAGLLVRRTGV
jgi:hypothetical protein